jgi:hypothetical protein
LEIGNHAEVLKTRQILWIDEFQMSNLMARVAAAVEGTGVFERIQRHPSGAVADGMNMYLEAFNI